MVLRASDNSAEYGGVNLTPRNWATLAKETMDSWASRNRGPNPTSSHAMALGTVMNSTIVDHDLTETEKPSPWTRVTAKISASASESVQASMGSATIGGGGAASLWWGLGDSASHSTSSMSAASSISNLDVEVSMDCMLVEIQRPWLHAELFADDDLDVPPGFRISPGPQVLRRAAADNKAIDADYTKFCSYPSAFILASNIELSFKGDTSTLEMSLEASSTQAKASVGWGPFSISSSDDSSKSSARIKAESTINRMEISLQDPHIIAWVSELLPSLPRDQAYKFT